jgi:hypothetical protein
MRPYLLRGIHCLLYAVWILWPCAAYPEDWRPVSVDGKGKGKGVYVDSDRALHIGSFVTLFMRETLLPDELARRGGLQRDIALRIDCGKPEALVAYGDLLFKDGRTVRFYGESQADQYAKPAELPFIETSLFASLQQGLCALPGEKLVEIARDGEDVRTQVNIASVVRKGEEVQAWVRFDYPVVALGLPYRNPYGSKRELMSFLCARSEYAVLAGLAFDDDEVISDGASFQQPGYEKVDDPASAELLQMLCESSGDLQRLPTPQLARAKPKVWEMPLDPVPVEAPATLKDALGRAAGGEKALRLRIRRAIIETVGTTPDGQKQNSLEERTFQSRGGGLVLTSAKAPEYSFEDLSLYGLITVGSRSSYPRGGGSSRKLEHITFSGTLVSAIAGGAVTYELAYAGIDTVAGRSQSRSRTECKLGAAQSATKLNAKLTGDAIPVECETAMQGGPSSKMRGWLLLDAGWYFQEMFETDYYRGESRLVEVEGN